MDDKSERIQIHLNNSVIDIGIIKYHGEDRKFNRSGPDPESICVHNLVGSFELYHIEWTTFSQGSGSWVQWHYIVCEKHNTDNILLSDSITLRGKWGYGTGISNDYFIIYKNNRIVIKITTLEIDQSETNKPLFHENKHDDGRQKYVCEINKVLTRNYIVLNGSAEIESAILEYKVQNGDTVQDICVGLEIDKQWIHNIDLFDKGVSWLQIVIPNEECKIKYPKIEEK